MVMTNPKLGQFEIETILQMTDDDFELYLNDAVMLYCQSPGPMPPHVFRSLLILLRYAGGAEDADLKEMQTKSEDTKDHVAFELRRLAHWATIWPVGAFLSRQRYGVDPGRL
jgi:hypothetical protein